MLNLEKSILRIKNFMKNTIVDIQQTWVLPCNIAISFSYLLKIECVLFLSITGCYSLTLILTDTCQSFIFLVLVQCHE